MDGPISALLTDLYQLNMVQAYLEYDKIETAVFEFYVRRLPKQRGFLLAAGLEQALSFLETLCFSDDEIKWLEGTDRFSKGLLQALSRLRFTGDVHALPEGTVFFENEPILRVTAPLPQAQLVETRLINILQFQTIIASKAARMALLAPGKQLVDFGLRRAHGADAGLFAARASYIGGFTGTATLLANREFGIPIYGTMAHSFVEVFDDERASFEAFSGSRQEGLVLLIDTYDTEAASRKVVALAPQLKSRGIQIHGVRIDSGDLAVLSRTVRPILDQGGLADTIIFASGGLDEEQIAAIVQDDAPIDGFGVGTSLVTSSDAPALDCAYKLQEYAGIARRKRSIGKETWPGRKQAWRSLGRDGRMTFDRLSVEDDQIEGEPLLHHVMQAGHRILRPQSLDEIRSRAARNLALLPDELRGLVPGIRYPVIVQPRLRQLAEEVDRRTQSHA